MKMTAAASAAEVKLEFCSNYALLSLPHLGVYSILQCSKKVGNTIWFESDGSQRERLSVCDGSSECNLKPAAAFITGSVMNIVSDSWSGVKQKNRLHYFFIWLMVTS